MIINSIAGGTRANASTSGGKVYGYNNIDDVTLRQVAPANQQRTRLVFHNPGATDVFVYPQYQLNTGSNVAILPTNATLGGTFLVFANGGTLIVEGECQQAWFALGKTGAAAAPLTVMDSNV